MFFCGFANFAGYQSMKSVVMSFVILTLVIFTGLSDGQSIISGPKQVTEKIRGSAKFGCEVDFEGGIKTMQWLFYDAIIYVFVKEEEEFPWGHAKYSVMQDGRTFNLTVKDLDFSNGGKYTCTVLTDSAAALLIVLDTPELLSPTPDQAEGTTAQYICKAKFSGPSKKDDFPQLLMSFGGVQLNATVQLQEPKEFTDFYQYTQTHNITLDSSMKGDQLLCNIGTSDPAMHVDVATEIQVLWTVNNVDYNPKRAKYEVGEVIYCTADGSPKPQFVWEDMRQQAISVNGPSLKITKEMLGSNTWRCTAKNLITGQIHKENIVAIFEAESPAGDDLLSASGNDSWKIGVGVGVPVVICLVVIIVVLLYWCKKHRTADRKNGKYTPVGQSDPEKQQNSDGEKVQIQGNTPLEATENGNTRSPVNDSDDESSTYDEVMTPQDAAKQDTGKYNIPEQNHEKEDNVPKEDIDKDDEIMEQDTGKDSQDFAPLSIRDQTDGQYPDQQEYPRPAPMPVNENLSGLPQSYTSDKNGPTSDTHNQENYVQEGDGSLQSQTSEPYYTPVQNMGNDDQQKKPINKNTEDKPQSPQIQDVQAEPPVSEKNQQVKMTSDDKAKGLLDQAKKTPDEKPRGAPRPLNKALQPRVQDVQEKSTVSSMPKQKTTNGNMKQTTVHQPPQGKVSKPVSQTAVHQDTQGIVPKPATTHQDKNCDSVTTDICNTEISKEKSFHGLLPREEVQHILQQDGDYLITYQSSEQTGQVHYKLSFMWNQKIRNVPITYKGGKCIFNEKHEFHTARSFITSLSNKQWDLAAGSLVSLKRAVVREEWELNTEDIVLENDTSTGNLGEFINGKHLGKEVTIHVHDETVVDLSTFFHGGRLLKGYQHENIAKFIGIAVSKQPVMMVMQHESGGVLQTFLQNHRDKLQLTQRMKMCEDVSAAITYLKEQSCIHRYIAAHNCLVGGSGAVKISNFSMAREGEEYQADKSEPAPTKWTALEALKERKYTHLSDVWSFGILMWEIFSFGEIPYEKIPDKDLLKQIGQGFRLPCPKGTPNEIHNFMKLCWTGNPRERPDILALTSKLVFVAKRLSFLK